MFMFYICVWKVDVLDEIACIGGRGLPDDVEANHPDY